MWSTAVYSMYFFGILYVSAHVIEDSQKLQDIGYRKITGPTTKTLTLFVDVDETLLWRQSKRELNLDQVVFRTGLEDFLIKMSEKFEVVVFTRATKEHGRALVSKIESRTTAANRGETFKFADAFFQDDCTQVKGKRFNHDVYGEVALVYKDISHRGRLLENCFLLDDDKMNFYTCGIQGIQIYRCWNTEDKRPYLQQAADFLTTLADADPEERESLLRNPSRRLPLIEPPPEQQSEEGSFV